MFKVIVREWTGIRWEIVRVVSATESLAAARATVRELNREIDRKDPYFWDNAHTYDVFDDDEKIIVN